MTISIGNDHAGPDYKTAIVEHLKSKGITVNNYGTDTLDSVDYPDFVHPVANAVVSQKAEAAKSALSAAMKQRDIAQNKADEAAQYAKKAGEYYDNWETIGGIFGVSGTTTDNKNAFDDSDTQQSDDFNGALPEYDNWQVIGDLFGLSLKQENSKATQTKFSATESSNL